MNLLPSSVLTRAATHWLLISSGWSFIKNSIFTIAARTAFVSGYGTSSSDRIARPSSRSSFQNWSSIDLMTTQGVLFSLFMVSLLWFWLTQPRPWKHYFFLRKTSAICGWFYLTKDFSFFLFFLLSLFAPLNGIQQLEDISDTQLSGSFYLLFVPYGHNLCVTQPCHHGVFG